jgi:hypothetical protein
LARPRSRKSRRWPSSNLAQRTQVTPDHKVTLHLIVSISRETRPLISLPTSLQGCGPRPIRMIRSPAHCCLDIHRRNPIRKRRLIKSRSPRLMEEGLMTFAPSNEISSTIPRLARSAVSHRFKPMRVNEQSKYADAAYIFKQHLTLEWQNLTTNGRSLRNSR